MITHTAKRIFERAVDDYHIKNDVDQPFKNPFDTDVDFLEHLLYRKAWIDTVQWHYEDIIRDPQIDPVAALKLKRQIDSSNQERTDMVEYIDSYFLNCKHLNAKKAEDIKKRQSISILIGPEGDFSPQEREQILASSNLTSFTLSRNILRTDTAVISAISLINFIHNNH